MKCNDTMEKVRKPWVEINPDIKSKDKFQIARGKAIVAWEFRSPCHFKDATQDMLLHAKHPLVYTVDSLDDNVVGT